MNIFKAAVAALAFVVGVNASAAPLTQPKRAVRSEIKVVELANGFGVVVFKTQNGKMTSRMYRA